MISRLRRKDYAGARSVADEMSDAARQEPSTLFLLYKAGLMMGDSQFGK